MKKRFSAVVVVKTLGKAFDALRETGVPLIWVRLILLLHKDAVHVAWEDA